MTKFSEFINIIKNIEKKNLWLYIVGGLFAIYLIFVGLEYAFYAQRFGPFTRIAGVKVGNQTKAEATKKITAAWTKYVKENVIISEQNLVPENFITEVKIRETVEAALASQSKGFGELSVFNNKNTTLKLVLNDKAFQNFFDQENEKIFVAFQNANIVLEPEVQIIPEKEGREVIFDKSKDSLAETFGNLKKTGELVVEKNVPTVTEKEARELIDEARSAVSTDLKIQTETGEYAIKKEELLTWLELDRAAEASGRKYDFFAKEKVSAWVENLSKVINKEPQNALLTIKDGKASVFEASHSGYKLDASDTNNKILAAAAGDKTFRVEGKVTLPEITEEKINNLGIKEQISVGYSDFAGSAKNRIHNIKTGAAKFNGILVKPGENFSFNKILGPVDASTGYLPELVIINNKTEPQFGGGLCQVSSTAFRAALNAGLPIVARSAHAYPVSYYKPFGVDASIYLPKPDLVFTNDTNAHILVQTKIVGTKIYFEFYGTKAARTVKFSGNQDGIGSTEIVEKMTPTISDQGIRGPGSFTAVFYRHIYDANGKLTDNDKFTSKYDSPEKYPKATQ